MAHHHPVNTIALERIDRFAYDGTHIACALDMAKGLHSSFVGLPSPHQRELDPVPDLYFLNRMGFTEIAVSLPAGSVPARLNSLLGSPVAESDSMVIWPIPDVVPARAAETVEWDDRYERRLAQLEKEGCIFTGGKPKGPVADLEEKAAELDTLELPAEPPFLARTRQAPVTMVNAEGKPSEVLEALAVEVEVLEWNDAAARVRCTGCREELVGWVPTNQLLVEELDPNRTEDRLARFLLLATQQNPALAAGVQDNGSEWIAPPWAQEEDYSGTSWSIRESGVSFVLDAAPASVDDKLEEAAGAATK
jgi:hypothetical protein